VIPLHLGKYYRRLFEELGLLVVIGDFPEVLVSKNLYEEKHKITRIKGEQARTFEKIMASTLLAAISLSERESWGWTISLPGSSDGIFCGVEPEGMICGRVKASEKETNMIYLQRKKDELPLMQSSYEPNTDDPALAIQRYFEQVEQIKTRIAIKENGSGVLVQSLPGGRFEEIENLTNDELIELFETKNINGLLKDVGEVVVFYECRCNDEMILKMITSLEQDQQNDIWGNEKHLNIECPRCGREYTINRPLKI